MKLLNLQLVVALACAGLFTTGVINAENENDVVSILPIQEEEKETREPLTAKENNTINEERLSHFPNELLQSSSLFDYREDFKDYQYIPFVHPDADHAIVGCSDSGDIIELNDQTEWTIAFSARNIVRNWRSDDLLYIKPKYSWFSSYGYVIQNRTTSEYADADILSVPLYNVSGSLFIVDIDVTNRIVLLNDDTLWQINPSDYSFRKWRVGDRLITGVNNYWRMASFSHILINATYYDNPYSNSYCEAKFIGSPPAS